MSEDLTFAFKGSFWSLNPNPNLMFEKHLFIKRGIAEGKSRKTTFGTTATPNKKASTSAPKVKIKFKNNTPVQ